MIIGYPSTDFPSPPTVAMYLPEGWQGAHYPDTLLAIHEPSTTGSFVANIVVRARRYQRTPAAELISALTAETEGHEATRTEMFDFAPPALYRVLQPVADGQQINQQHLLAILDEKDGEITWAVNIIGSSAFDDESTFETIADTLRNTNISKPD